MTKIESSRKPRLTPWALGVALALALTACGGQGGGGGALPIGVPSAGDLTTGAGASTPAAPGAGSGSGIPGTTREPTLKEQIEALENSGAIAKLDRSTDIAGPDTNQNGVRDDIEAWIGTLPVNNAQRKALMQKAKALQTTLLVDLKDRAAMDRSGDQLMASSRCGSINFSPYEVFSGLAAKIEGMTANTKERAMRYMRYNSASSGSSTTLPNGDTCEP